MPTLALTPGDVFALTLVLGALLYASLVARSMRHSLQAEHDRERLWDQAARREGWTFTAHPQDHDEPASPAPPTRRLTGAYAGQRLTLREDRAQHVRGTLTLDLPLTDHPFTLHTRAVPYTRARVATGDASFDRAFALHSATPDATVALLTSDLRAALLDLHRDAYAITLHRDRLDWASHAPTNDPELTRLLRALDAVAHALRDLQHTAAPALAHASSPAAAVVAAPAPAALNARLRVAPHLSAPRLALKRAG